MVLSNIESQFLPNGPTFNFIISAVFLQKYELRIDASIIPADASKINVKFLNLVGKSGSLLINKELNTSLVPVVAEETENSEPEEETIGGMSSEDASLYLVIAGLVASAGVSLLSRNTSALWIFINFSLMIYFMPLQNINMPSSLRELCKAFGTDLFGLILNFSDIITLDSDSLETKELWKIYDIENTSFYENTGNVIFLFLVGFAMLPVLGILYLTTRALKLMGLSNFLLKMILQYRWNFFLRSSIESYIEILFYAILCALTVFEKSLDSEIVLSIILCVICLFIPLLLTFFTCKFKDFIISEGSDLSKFSTHFEEFKTDKFDRLLYYPLFYFRRLCYMVGIYSLYYYPLLQVIMNSFFSFVIFGYISIYKPYKNAPERALSAMSEFFLGVIFIATGLCLLGLSEENVNVVRNIILYGVLTVIAANVFTSIMLILKSFKSRCKNKNKDKKPRTVRIIPELILNNSNNITSIYTQTGQNECEKVKEIDINSIY